MIVAATSPASSSASTSSGGAGQHAQIAGLPGSNPPRNRGPIGPTEEHLHGRARRNRLARTENGSGRRGPGARRRASPPTGRRHRTAYRWTGRPGCRHRPVTPPATADGVVPRELRPGTRHRVRRRSSVASPRSRPAPRGRQCSRRAPPRRARSDPRDGRRPRAGRRWSPRAGCRSRSARRPGDRRRDCRRSTGTARRDRGRCRRG